MLFLRKGIAGFICVSAFQSKLAGNYLKNISLVLVFVCAKQFLFFSKLFEKIVQFGAQRLREGGQLHPELLVQCQLPMLYSSLGRTMSMRLALYMLCPKRCRECLGKNASWPAKGPELIRKIPHSVAFFSPPSGLLSSITCSPDKDKKIYFQMQHLSAYLSSQIGRQ